MVAFHPLFTSSVLFWSCLPLVAPQALHLRKHAARWPAAAGPRSGCVDANGSTLRPLRLLALGDSPLEGVAIERIEDSLAVRLAQRLAEACERPVDWSIAARSGASVHVVRTEIWPTAKMPSPDLTLVSVGVNDVTGLTRRQSFASELTGLLQSLRASSPQGLVVLLAVPPMQAFPLLPQPLRAWLGGRSQALDRVGRACAERTGARHLPFELEPARGLFAADGFHPSSAGHARWAEQVFAALLARGSVQQWRQN